MVLDEADVMLSTGFKEQIYNLFQYFHVDIQVAIFSATLPPDILLLTEKFMRNPGDNPELAEKLLKDPEFAKIYNNSLSDEEKSSLEQSADNSADKSPGLVDGAMDGFKGMVGLSLLKSFARFV